MINICVHLFCLFAVICSFAFAMFKVKLGHAQIKKLCCSKYCSHLSNLFYKVFVWFFCSGNDEQVVVHDIER